MSKTSGAPITCLHWEQNAEPSVLSDLPWGCRAPSDPVNQHVPRVLLEKDFKLIHLKSWSTKGANGTKLMFCFILFIKPGNTIITVTLCFWCLESCHCVGHSYHPSQLGCQRFVDPSYCELSVRRHIVVYSDRKQAGWCDQSDVYCSRSFGADFQGSRWMKNKTKQK